MKSGRRVSRKATQRIFESELGLALSWLSNKYTVPRPLLIVSSIALVEKLGGKHARGLTTTPKEFAPVFPRKKSVDGFLKDMEGFLETPLIIVSIDRKEPTRTMFTLFHEFHHCLDMLRDPSSFQASKKHTGWNSFLERGITKRAKKDLIEYAKSLSSKFSRN